MISSKKLTIRSLIKMLMDFDMNAEILIEDSDGGSSHLLKEEDLIPISRDDQEILLLTKYK